ncbi:hypothetical protein [Grimontia indica]|uniref:hypothetical protein n=1 Tax=Grimontia indica TaxID=1056512 RepID=UPI000587F30F|nr:hypothetical protein [Grimontia indica]
MEVSIAYIYQYKRMKRLLFFAVLLITTQACTVTYVQEDGSKRIIGFADIVIEEPKDKAIHKTSVKNIGITIFNSALMDGIGVGYTEESIVAVGDNTCVLIEE